MTTFIETRAGHISADRVVRIRQRWTNADPRGMRTEIEYIDAAGDASVTHATDPDFDPARLTAPLSPANSAFRPSAGRDWRCSLNTGGKPARRCRPLLPPDPALKEASL